MSIIYLALSGLYRGSFFSIVKSIFLLLFYSILKLFLPNSLFLVSLSLLSPFFPFESPLKVLDSWLASELLGSILNEETLD